MFPPAVQEASTVALTRAALALVHPRRDAELTPVAPSPVRLSSPRSEPINYAALEEALAAADAAIARFRTASG